MSASFPSETGWEPYGSSQQAAAVGWRASATHAAPIPTPTPTPTPRWRRPPPHEADVLRRDDRDRQLLSTQQTILQTLSTIATGKEKKEVQEVKHAVDRLVSSVDNLHGVVKRSERKVEGLCEAVDRVELMIKELKRDKEVYRSGMCYGRVAKVGRKEEESETTVGLESEQELPEVIVVDSDSEDSVFHGVKKRNAEEGFDMHPLVGMWEDMIPRRSRKKSIGNGVSDGRGVLAEDEIVPCPRVKKRKRRRV